MKKQLSQIVIKLLKENGILYDKKELEFQIKSHPSYPSLHAITGVLNHFNIENVAAQVPSSSEALKELPTCFLAQINDNNKKSLVIVRKSKGKLSIFNGAKKTVSLLKDEFIEKFTGIIVAVEKNGNKTQTSVKTRFNKSISILLLTILTGLFIYLYFNWVDSIYTYLYSSLSVVGILISIAIVKQEIGLETAIGNAFCSGNSEKKDCDAVLTSKGAEIIKGYKFSDLSLLYFTGLFFLTLFLAINPSIAFSVSLLAMPITIYSIYYQYVVVKKWCLLCLTIVAVLWLQAIVVLLSKNFLFTVTKEEVVIFVFTFSLVFLLWIYLKPLVLELNSLRKEKIKATKFQRNYTLFKNLLFTSKPIETKLIEDNEIIFGNINSKLELIVITNPFCGHCKPVHKIVEDLITKYCNEVRIIIRFNINVSDLESDVVKITSRLLEINTRDKNECLTAMSDIYGGMSREKWFLKWGNCKEKEKFETVLKEEKNWCLKNNINFTPEILINGKSYPKEYNKADLIYFMEDLIENS